MVDGIKTKTNTISNGDPIDATPVDSMFSDLYANDSALNNAIIAIAAMFSNGNLTATFINEAVSGRGVAVDNVLLQDGMARLLAIRCNILSTTTGSAILTTSSNGLITGIPVKYMTAPGVGVDGGLSTILTYYARVIDDTHIQLHPTLTDAQNNTNPITVTSAVTGLRYIIADPASTPGDGRLWIDPDGMHFTLNGAIFDIASDSYSLLSRVSGTKTPVYASPTTFTVNRISERDSGNNVSIIKSSSTTIDISTIGINGIAQSGNLSGTITVTAGSTSVTFSASQSANLIANDVITTAGGQARKLISVSGTTGIVESQFTTTETAVTFKRGGRASFYTANTSGTTGTAHYYLYAISNGTTSGLILSTRNVAKGETLVDLPSGYTYSKLLPFSVTLYNTSTATGVYVGNIIPFRVGAGWPYRPEVFLNLPKTKWIGSQFVGAANVLQGGNQTSYTAIDVSGFIPGISRLGIFLMSQTGSVTSQSSSIRSTGGTADEMSIFGYGTAYIPEGHCGTSSNQSIDYAVNSGTANLYIDVVGYIVTEIF